MRDIIVFALQQGRILCEEKLDEIENFNKILEGTPVQLKIEQRKDDTYIMIEFDDERKG